MTAQSEARDAGDFRITTGHLLLGLLNELDGSAAECLAGLGLDLETVRAGVAALDTGLRPGHEIRPGLSASMKGVLAHAAESSRRLRHRAVTSGHLLVGLLEDNDSLGALVLSESGVKLHGLRREVRRALRYDWSYGDDDWAPRTPPLVVAFAGERTVAHSASAVWALMEPVENFRLLYPDAAGEEYQAERMPGFPRGVGERTAWTRTKGGVRRTEVTEYVEFQPERRLVSRLVTASAPTTYLQTTLTVTPVRESETIIRMEVQLEFSHPDRRGIAAAAAGQSVSTDSLLAQVESLLDSRDDASAESERVSATK